jgi:uncharacterized protein with ACT and thioredoxin-like domain
MLTNNVALTDNELSVILASLDMAIMSYERYQQQNGNVGLDYQTQKGIEEMKTLRKRLEKEYF